LTTIQDHDSEFDVLRDRVWAARPRLIPPTIMDWPNGPPPPRWRLSIDDEIINMARGKRQPCIRSDPTILAEFPTLHWDGPYRAVRFYLFGFMMFGMHDNMATPNRRRAAKAVIALLRDIKLSIHAYVDVMETVYEATKNKTASQKINKGQYLWYENFNALKKALGNAEFLESVARKSLVNSKKGGRPPMPWKADFVSGLAELWRIMTGCDASKDLTSAFASFVSAAWSSLGDELPEISWASQIRRREELPTLAELTEWANSTRYHSLEYLSYKKSLRG
jgi:hypothetical protein